MLLAALSSVLVLLASHVGGQEPILKFRGVETELDCHELSDYICGKDVYKDFAHEGLPSNFAIKKRADLVITVGDIKAIKVTCRQYGTFDSWELHFVFNESIAKDIEIYTTANPRKRVAMEVGDEIMSVVTIRDKMTTDIALAATKNHIFQFLLTVLSNESRQYLSRIPITPTECHLTLGPTIKHI
jgi:preprotein translocase subunit SecD